MNLALPALIVFVVLLPGFIFRAGLMRAESESLDFSPFGKVAADGIRYAVILHGLWLLLASLLGQKFQPLLMLQLLSSHPPTQAAATGAVASDSTSIAACFVTLLLVAYAVPVFIGFFIRKFKLDREGARFSSIFRFYDAPWYYLLTGADFAKRDEPDIIYVSAVVELAKDSFLYVGVLNDFYFDKDGQLDRLILQNVKRRPMSSDKHLNGNATDRFYPIDGDSFVLRYSEAITLNIQYVKLVAPDAIPPSAL